MEVPRRMASWLLAFGCGLLTGVSLGILLAPARGREVRREIVSTARRGREEASKLVDRSRRAAVRQKERVDQIMHVAGQQVGEIQAGVTSAVHDAKAAFERGRQQVLPR